MLFIEGTEEQEKEFKQLAHKSGLACTKSKQDFFFRSATVKSALKQPDGTYKVVDRIV